ncbi:hypothetical protein FD51_GL002730 [Lacticaseibacillus zeae DSM 20178 = KCTC 3804]|uniref:Uncharacterized protein n=1 Tax=Lacticaseibacillus zeae DSM 20178 = KCTC 3804 TaxID=1423816 RepID=A0A0R1ETG7_LACZE|nr:hypothetical protein FD51_GL002730 [Lacticaseibacillus zeae DSM 20178 = KCTC 3804]
MPAYVDVISIHAVTWTATKRPTGLLCWLLISIHAVTWTATRHAKPNEQRPLISIHAVTWTATDTDSIFMRISY